MEDFLSFTFIIGLDWQVLLLICAIAVVTSAIHGATGMAGGFLLAAALATVIGVKPVVPVMSVAMLVSHSTRIWLNLRSLNSYVFLSIMLPALPFIILMSFLYAQMSSVLISLILACIILLSVPLRHWAQNRKITVKPRAFYALGGIYGALSGTSIGPGMLLVPFMLNYGLRKEAFVATMAALGLATNVLRVSVYSATDLLIGGYFTLGVLVGLMTIPGNWLGRMVLRRISGARHGLLVDILSVLGGLNFFYLALRV